VKGHFPPGLPGCARLSLRHANSEQELAQFLAALQQEILQG